MKDNTMAKVQNQPYPLAITAQEGEQMAAMLDQIFKAVPEAARARTSSICDKLRSALCHPNPP
jgi:hypothetical protein